MTDKISNTFGITPMAPAKLPAPRDGKEEVQSDASEARANLKGLMDTATQALEGALELARQSDSPRAYEVLATLINAAADLNTRILETHSTEQKIAKGNFPEEKGSITNNNVFVGTTAELHELMSRRRNNEAIGN